MYINWKRKEIVVTIALYGPHQSGKTTTWHCLARGASDGPAEGDDTFSLRLDDVQGKRLILNVRDIPGGEQAATHRRVALYGVDGIVFVATSEPGKEESNCRSFGELEENLGAMKHSIQHMPFLFQYNKRDLPDALSIEAMQTVLNVDRKFPYQETCATKGDGIVEILRQSTDLVLATLLQ